MSKISDVGAGKGILKRLLVKTQVGQNLSVKDVLSLAQKSSFEGLVPCIHLVQKYLCKDG